MTKPRARATERNTREITALSKRFVRLLGVDPADGDILGLIERVEALDSFQKKSLAKFCDDRLGIWRLRMDARSRWGLIGVLVALTPESEPLIRKWLSTFSGKAVFEVHFTLFVLLNFVDCVDGAERFADRLHEIAEGYLMNVSARTASAAMNAGCFLADVPLDRSFPVMAKVAREAKYAAGRYGAIHAMEHVLERASTSKLFRQQATLVLRDVQRNDRSAALRASASWKLKEHAAPRGGKRARNKPSD